jgi:hypothetical protein
MFKYPQPVKFHKKTAQFQVDLKPAREIADESTGKLKVEEGCIFFSLAKALEDGSGRMDWNNKILMKIEPNDIAKIVVGLKSNKSVDIFHKSSEVKSTTLKIEAGQNPGTYKFTMGMKDGSRNLMGNIYLNSEDLFVIFNLLEASIPLTLGWC